MDTTSHRPAIISGTADSPHGQPGQGCGRAGKTSHQGGGHGASSRTHITSRWTRDWRWDSVSLECCVFVRPDAWIVFRCNNILLRNPFMLSQFIGSNSLTILNPPLFAKYFWLCVHNVFFIWFNWILHFWKSNFLWVGCFFIIKNVMIIKNWWAYLLWNFYREIIINIT